MRARDVMVRAVTTTTPETTVEKVARLMINLRIRGFPFWTRTDSSSESLPKGTCCAGQRPGPSAGARAGASGFRQILGWLRNTSSRTPGGWRTS